MPFKKRIFQASIYNFSWVLESSFRITEQNASSDNYNKHYLYGDHGVGRWFNRCGSGEYGIESVMKLNIWNSTKYVK